MAFLTNNWYKILLVVVLLVNLGLLAGVKFNDMEHMKGDIKELQANAKADEELLNALSTFTEVQEERWKHFNEWKGDLKDQLDRMENRINGR